MDIEGTPRAPVQYFYPQDLGVEPVYSLVQQLQIKEACSCICCTVPRLCVLWKCVCG